MLKVADWEIKVGNDFENQVVLFENLNKVIAVQCGKIIAIIWEVTAGMPRIEADNIAFVIDGETKSIFLKPQKTLDYILEYESKQKSTHNS